MEQKNQIWDEYNKFKKDYELSLKHNKTLPDMIKEIMSEKNMTIELLHEKSNISTSTIHRLRSGKLKTRTRIVEYKPYISTIIAFAIACELDMILTITLLESQGLSFKRTSEVHYAYCYLILNCRGNTIDECNEKLKELGIEEQYYIPNRLI